MAGDFHQDENSYTIRYYEEYQYVYDAIQREKQLKGGSRQKKIDVIEKMNPKREDFSADWY